MLRMVLVSLVALAVQQQAPVTIVQKTSGWCSPAIANVVGNVTVNCIGVDPRALKRLNAQLSVMKLDRDTALQAADEWTTRYKELEARLSEAGDDNELSRQAEEYLHQGELEKAGAILDQILGKEDRQTDRTAANHYNRGLVLELQFLPLEALPHFKKAYDLAAANEDASAEVKYGREYSYVLQNQNDFKRAEPVLLATLDQARQLAKENPAVYQSDVAGSLNNLANLYSDTQRLKEAEAAYQEALDIYQQLAKTNPAAYEPDVAQTLNNLAFLHLQTGNLSRATEESREAVSINRERWKANATVAGDDLAKSLIVASLAQTDSSTKCKLVLEAASVAQTLTLKEAINGQAGACPPP